MQSKFMESGRGDIIPHATLDVWKEYDAVGQEEGRAEDATEETPFDTPHS